MTQSPDDTIVALATPPGRGGLAVVRLSGPRARAIAARLIEPRVDLEPRRATLVRLVARGQGGAEPRAVDEAIATAFAAPSSYTGEDVVEFSLHGSPVVAAEVIAAALGAGARPARPGEFTLRAFLNGRLDLTQAEAVQDLVSATTPIQARMAFDQLQGGLAERIAGIERALFDLAARLEASVDFPEEGYHFIARDEAMQEVRRIRERIDALLADAARGRLLREGATIAILGRPNVGKSTLFNRLVGVDRAIVTDVPGTTRDLLTESVGLGGARVTLVDTAGVRATSDPIEREGVARAEKAGEVADVVIVVLDQSAALTEEDERVLASSAAGRRVIAVNKCDLPPAWEVSQLVQGGALPPSSTDLFVISATTGAGLDVLVRAVNQRLWPIDQSFNMPVISNLRHISLLGRASDALARLDRTWADSIGQMPEELVLADLQAAREALEEVTGKRSSEDLLEAIFSRFCIGK